MQALIRFSLRRPSIIIMAMILVVFGGLISISQLKSELLPNIEFPVVSVVTVYPGAAPDDVRRDVTEPIEKVIAGTPNLKTLTSYSNDSVSFVIAEYEFGTDMEKTQQSMQDALNRETFPTQVQRPSISRSSFQDIPVIVYTVNTDDKSEDALVNLRRDLETNLVPELKGISGVNSVVLAGGGDKKVVITYNDEQLSEEGVTASAINGLLQANNVSFPAGQIVNSGQAIPVRVGNEFTTVDQLRNLVVKPSGPEVRPAGSGPAGGAPGGPPGGPPSQSGQPASDQQAPQTGEPAATPPEQSGQPVAGQPAVAPANPAAPDSQQPVAPSPEPPTATPQPPTPTATPEPEKTTAPVTLGNVASVELVNADSETVSRSNGKPSLSLLIYKTQNANTVQVADAVNARVDELKSEVPGTQVVVLFDSSTFIKESIDGLVREGLLGALLAIIVILLFLRSVRSTLVTALSIPLSILMALVMLNVFDISLNIMSLAGLAVAVGRVVDDSIVVLENIYRHHYQNGEPIREASYNGTKEVALAITSSTITTVCVFLPLGFIAGLVSEFFRPFAVAVTVSLLASLLVALTVIPVLAMFFLKSKQVMARNVQSPVPSNQPPVPSSSQSPALVSQQMNSEAYGDGRSAETLSPVGSQLAAIGYQLLTISRQLTVAGSQSPQPVATSVTPAASSQPPIPNPKEQRDTLVQKLYTPAIRWSLKNTWTKLAVLGVAIALFVGSMYLSQYIGLSFINFGSDKVLSATVKMQPGTDLKKTSDTAAALEAEIQKHSNVLNYQTTIGSNSSAAATGFARLGDASSADMTITMDREVDIREEADWFRALIESKAAELSIDDFSVTSGTGSGPNSSGFSAVVSGSDYEDVVKTSDELVAKLKDVPDLVNVTSDAARAKSEIRVDVDPDKALEHGSTAIQIAGQVRNLLTNQKVSEVTIGGKKYDVEATYDSDTLTSLDDIKSIEVGAFNPVPLSEIAEVTEADGPVSITRINQDRAITVRGTINSESTSGVTMEAQKAIDALTPGSSTEVSITGVSEQQAEAFGQLSTALIIAIALVYLVMVLTFGSLLTPFVIMFSLPLAAIGSIFALYITGRPLGVSALIGVLMLVGIVVTNAIVLLDLVEQYQRRGMNTYDALVQGGRTRVRPILMTAIATMFALMPLVLGFSEGSIIAAELGTVVVGGLFSSTFLTLMIIPVIYSLLHGLKHRFSRRSNDDEAAGEESSNGIEHMLDDPSLRELEDELKDTRPVQPVGV